MSSRSDRYGAAFAVATLLLLNATTASADTVALYASSASFAASAGNLTTITFDILGFQTVGESFNDANGLTTSGVNFTGLSTFPNGDTFNVLGVIDPLTFTDLYLGFGQLLVGGGIANNTQHLDGLITATLPGNSTAVGFQYGLNGLQPGTFSVDVVTAAGDHTFTVTSGAGAAGSRFVGFVADDPISQVKISVLGSSLAPGRSGDILIDNFSFNQASSPASAAPLPGSANAGLGLLGGLGLVTLARQRRKHHR